MNESQKTQKLLARTRIEVPDAYIRKVNERLSGGVPDIDIVIAGRSVRIECKVEGNDLTELQRRTMDKLASAGAKCYVLVFVKAQPWPRFHIHSWAEYRDGLHSDTHCWISLSHLLEEVAR